jgi:CubicO group peptidase (beta-lactamase class C family)
MPAPLLTIPASASGQRLQFGAAYTVLEEAIADRAFPGAAFGILAGGEVLALDGVGRFTYDPASNPVTFSTVYDLASVTKVIATTSMAMLLYQRGKLDLDEPLPAILAGRVTPRLLLAHASGLHGYERLFERFRDREDLLNACRHLPLIHPPGTHSEYSDPGFILLGETLSAITGEAIDAFCTREVFNLLNMTSTRFCPPEEWRSLIPPTEEDLTFRHRILQGEVQDENCFVLGGVAGHAGLFSNALDPLRYVQALFDHQPFTPETVQLFTTRAELPAGSSRALGWDTPSAPSSSGTWFSQHSAGHLGYAGTSLWIDFERLVAVVLLTNRTWPDRQSQAIRVVRPAFHNAVMDALARMGQ